MVFLKFECGARPQGRAPVVFGCEPHGSAGLALAMVSHAAVVLPATDLSADMALLESAGFFLDIIFPADEPRRAELSGHGINIVLDTQLEVPPPTIELLDIEPFETSGGALFISAPDALLAVPPRNDTFVHTQGGGFGMGRAGMEYRDLIPQRHGGRVIGSHIRVPGSGTVADYVHFHDVAFQMIWCLSGRVKLVYEDQGDPFWMEAGDCVVQPPGIRHRVLESEDDLEVIEVALPAEHRTRIDHQLALPNGADEGREYGGQRFLFERSAEREGQNNDGWEVAKTGVSVSTAGLATVRTLRATPTSGELTGVNNGDLCLFVVLSGSAAMTSGSHDIEISTHDSVAIPHGEQWRFDATVTDFHALHIEVGGVS